MLLDHRYAFGLSLLPPGLKKKFLEEGDTRDLIWHRPGADLAKKKTATVRDHEYIIPTKLHQNPSIGTGEEVENAKN